MMIICPSCRAAHVQGTLFCEQCGTSLIGVAPTDAEAADAESTQFTPAPNSAATEGGTLPTRRRGPDPNGATPVPGPGLAGAPLANSAALPAAGPAVDENPSTMPLSRDQERDTGRLAVGSVPTRLRVLVLNTGRLTDWIDDQVIHVGRTDRSANVFPSIDLETDGGHNAGVSRRHVRISRQPDGYYLEDLGSINGTFLNRRRLSPGNPTELKDGDEVRVGNIVLRVVLGGFQRPQ
ncbi:MAG TPA: FHA domain-containing protein [Chloroflexia bacterium]|nr:FHA domain-containing protein [Chloroflexia bacterium]